LYLFVGSSIIDKVPGLLPDDCYIALIHFASECLSVDTSSIFTSIPFLANVFTLIGCDSNANYFLYRCSNLLELGLSVTSSSSSVTSSLPSTTDISQETKEKTLTYTLILLRSLSNIQPSNAKFIVKNSKLFPLIIALLNNPSTVTVPAKGDEEKKDIQSGFQANDIILRETIILLNSLINDEEIRHFMKVYVTRSKLLSLVKLNYPSVNEVIIDLYLTLYECELPYIVEEQIYTVIGTTIDSQVIEEMFKSIVNTLQDIFSSSPSTSSSITDNNPATAPVVSLPSVASSQQVTGIHILKCNFIYRLLFKMESSLHLVSDITQFIKYKIKILKVLFPLFSSKLPTEWELHYVNLLDIIILIVKGCEYCWTIPKIDLLDSEFLHISNQLIYQFSENDNNNDHHGGADGEEHSSQNLHFPPPPPLSSSFGLNQLKSQEKEKEGNTNSNHKVINITNKLFDTKDRNSLNYLIGNDKESTIPLVLSRSFDGRNQIIEGGNDDEDDDKDGNEKGEKRSRNNSNGVVVSHQQSFADLVNGKNDDKNNSNHQKNRIYSKLISLSHKGNVGVEAVNSNNNNNTKKQTPDKKKKKNHKKGSKDKDKDNHEKKEKKVGEQQEEEEQDNDHNEKNINELISEYYENAINLETLRANEEAISLVRSFKTYLTSHLSALETIIVNWELHTIEVNCSKLLYFYLCIHFLGLSSELFSKIRENQLMYELLWKLLNQQNMLSSSTSSSPMKKGEKGGSSGKDRKGSSASSSSTIQDENHSSMIYNIKSMYGMNRKCIQLLTLLVIEKGSFDESVHFTEFLHLILTTRPERLSDITVSNGNGNQHSDNSSNNSGGGGGDGVNSPSKGGSGGDRDDEALLLSGRDNVSIFANLAFRMSSIDLLALSGGTVTMNPGSPSTSSNIPSFTTSSLIIVEDIVNMDIHYSAVSAILALSHYDRTVRRKMIVFTTNIIESLSFISPNDSINTKPMLYLVKSMIEFISKLELVNEETYIGLIIRCLKSPLLYINSQVCDLIYYIGNENPGFIYRGLSRKEVENELLSILSSSATASAYSATTGSGIDNGSSPQQQNSILLLNAIKASCVLIHNINIKPIWIPVTWLFHWSSYPTNSTSPATLIKDRTFLSNKTLAYILSILKNAPNHYRLIYFTYLLTFSSSLMYACVEGIIPNSLPSPGHSTKEGRNKDKEDTAARDRKGSGSNNKSEQEKGGGGSGSNVSGKSPSLPMTSSHNGSIDVSSEQLLAVLTPSQLIKDALISHILPLIPIAIDFIMTLGKKNKGRKSITSVDNPAISSPYSVSHKEETNIPSSDSYSQTMSNRFYQNNDKNPHLLYCCNEISQLFDSSTVTSTTTNNKASASASASSDVSYSLSPLQVIESIIHEKLDYHPFLPADQISYYASPIPSSSKSITSPNTTNLLSKEKESKNHTKLLTIFKSKPIEVLTEKTIECIFSFLCTDEMFPLSTYLQYISLFQTTPIIASIAYFMTENRNNSLILKRGLDCIKYFSDNQMSLSIIAMHTPLALIYCVKNMKEILDVQLCFVKIIYMITQLNDDFAKENLLRFNIHFLLIEMIHSNHYELSKISLQCILSLLTNDQNAILLTQNTGLIDSICTLLDSMNKDIKIQYYGMKILMLIDSYLPEMISQAATSGKGGNGSGASGKSIGNSNKSKDLFVIMKKSRKLLIQYMKTNYHYYYQNNIFQKAINNSMMGKGLHLGSGFSGLMGGGGGGNAARDSAGAGGNGGGNNDNNHAEGDSTVNSTGNDPSTASRSANNGQTKPNPNFVPLNDNIDKNDIEELLNNPIWQKEKCVIS
jgi:hypothetical protein